MDNIDDLLKKLEDYSKKSSSTNDEIKKSIKDIVESLKTSNGVTDKFLKQLAKVLASSSKVRDVFEDINEAIENNDAAYSSITDETKDLLKKLNALVEKQDDWRNSLNSSFSIMSRIQELLKEETDILNEQENIIDKVNKAKETSRDSERKFLAFSQNTLGRTLDTLNQQIRQHESVLDFVKLSGLEHTEIIAKLEEYGDTYESILGKISKSNNNTKEELEAIIKSHIETLTVQRAQYRQQRKLNDILIDTKEDIDSMYLQFSSIASMIPIIGGNLSKQFQKANAVAQKAADAIYEKFVETQNPMQALQAGMDVMNKGFGGLGGTLSSIALILVGVYKLFSNIDKKAAEISDKTGLSAEQSYQLYKNTLKANTLYSNQLSSMEDIEGLQTRLVGETGKLLKYNTSLLAKTSDLAINFGYSAETAGQLHSVFMQLAGDMPLEQAEQMSVKMQAMLGSMAEAHRIAPGIVAKDLVDNSDFVARAFAGMPEKAMRAAIEVRKLGYSLAQAAKTSDHLFDITGSLTSQMEASVALGRLVDLSAARRYALEGKTAEMMREITHQMGTYHDFTNMSVPQRMLLARSMGMEVGELQRSMFIRQELSHLSEQERAAAIDNLKNVEGILDMNAEQLELTNKQINKTKEFNNVMQKIKMALIDAVLPVAETLVPLFGTLAKILNLILIPLKVVKFIFESINFVITSIGKEISKITGGAFGQFFKDAYNYVVGIDKTVSNLSENTDNWIKGLVGGLAMLGIGYKLLKGGKGTPKSDTDDKGGGIFSRLFGTGNKQVSLLTQIRNILAGKRGLGGIGSGGAGAGAGQAGKGVLQKMKNIVPAMKTFVVGAVGKISSVGKGILGKTSTIGRNILGKTSTVGKNILGRTASVGKNLLGKAGPLAAAAAGFYSIGKGAYNVSSKEALSGGKGGAAQTTGNIIAGIGAEFVNLADKLSFGITDATFDKLNLGIKGLDISQTEQLRAAFRSMTGEQIGIGKKGNEELINWAKQNSEYLKTTGGLGDVIKSLESSPAIQQTEPIQSIQKEADIQSKSMDMSQLNNSMRELIELIRMLLIQEKKIVISFDDGTVRQIQQRSKQLGAV